MFKYKSSTLAQLSSIALLLSQSTSTTFAQASDNPFSLWYLSDAQSGWYFDAGLSIEREPTYTGSKNYVTENGALARAIYVSDSGKKYAISLGELGLSIPLKNDWLASFVLEYEEGRDNSQDAILTHFPDVENTVEGQISLSKRWGHWSAAAVLQPDILDRGKGFVYFFGGEYNKTFSNKFRTSVSLDISFADQEYFNTEIGVPSSVTNITSISTYTPSSGYKSTTLGFGLGYPINTHWDIFVNTDIEFYGSNMKDSPLINNFGKSTNYEFQLGIRYLF